MAKHDWNYTTLIGSSVGNLIPVLEEWEQEGWEIVSVSLGRNPEILARRLKDPPAAVLTSEITDPARETHLTHVWGHGTYCANCGTFFERKEREKDE